jgi:very-short-patch-repair endonuclease
VAWVVAQQLGLITASQLQLAGIGRRAIESRADRSLIQRMFRGVYLVGNPIPVPGARELGAVLACGPRALLSHSSAAAMWGLMLAPMGDVALTVVGRNCRSRPEITIHRVSHLAASDRATRDGIPLTAPARTLIDLAATAEDHELHRAIGEARVQGLVNDPDLRSAMRRAGRRAGVGRLSAALKSEDESDYSPSAAERRLRQLVRQARLPRPTYGAIVEGWPVDCLWPDRRLILEVDGYKFHGHRGAFERDRRKDMELVAAGYRVVRVTWRQLVQEPIAVAAMLAAALAV